MSLIKGLKDISAIELFNNGDVLVFQTTTCTSDMCRVGSIDVITLTNDIFDLEYLYMTNLERLNVFV